MQRPAIGTLLTGIAALTAIIALALRTDDSAMSVDRGAAPPSPPARLTQRDSFASVTEAQERFRGGRALLAMHFGQIDQGDKISRVPNGITGNVEVTIGGSIKGRIAGRMTGHVTSESTLPDTEPSPEASAIAPSDAIVRTLVATLPDPYDSHLDWMYDAHLDALRRAFEAAGFAPDQFQMVSPSDSVMVGSTLVSRRSIHPSVMLFRKRDKEQSEELWVVYLVPELPTTGIREIAMRSALAERKALVRLYGRNDTARVAVNKIRVLGPTFSGAQSSLLRALPSGVWDCARSASRSSIAKSDEGLESQSLCVVSGSATSLQRLPADSSVKSRESAVMRATVHSDATMQLVFARLVESLGVDSAHVAVFSESQTAYGATATDQAYLHVSFPLNLASLRAEFDRSTEAQEDARGLPGLTSNARTSISLGSSPQTRESPTVTSRLTVPALDVQLGDIERTLNLRRVRVILIVATDIRDKLILMRALRRSLPDVVFVVMENNVLLLRSEYRHALRGSYVISSYPLSLENEFWQVPKTAAGGMGPGELRSFNSDLSVGVFNAASILIGNDSGVVQYRAPGAVGFGSCLPPVWVSLIGSRTLMPIGFTYPDAGEFEYLAPGLGTGCQVPERSARAPSALSLRASNIDVHVAKTSVVPSRSAINGTYARWLALVALIVITLLLKALLYGSASQGLTADSLRRVATPAELLFATIFVLGLWASVVPLVTQSALEAVIWTSLRLVVVASLSGIPLLALLVAIGYNLWRHRSGSVLHVTRARPPVRWRPSERQNDQPSLQLRPVVHLAALVNAWCKEAPRAAKRSWMRRRPVLRLVRWLRRRLEHALAEKNGERANHMKVDAERYRAVTVDGMAPLVTGVVTTLLAGGTLVWAIVVFVRCDADRAACVVLQYRLSDLFGGASPTLVLMLFGLGLSLWAKWQLDAIRDLKRPANFEVALKVLGRTWPGTSLLRSLGHDMWRCRAVLVDLIPDESALRMLVFCLLALVGAGVLRVGDYAWIGTVEHVSTPGLAAGVFRCLVLLGLGSLILTTILGVLRFTVAWSVLQATLDLFSGSRMIRVFKSIPTEVVRAARPALFGEHSWRAPGFGIRGDPDALDGESRDVDPRPRVLRASYAVAASQLRRLDPSLRTAISARLRSVDQGSLEPDFLPTIRAAMALDAVGLFEEVSDPIGDSRYMRAKVGENEEAIAALAGFFALEVGFFVARIMFMLRRLAVAIVLSLLLIVVVTANYPFPPESSLRWVVTALLVFALTSMFVVIVRMSNSEVLRQITQTEDGASIEATVVLNLLIFAVIPLVGFLATEIPTVRSFLVAWIDPLTRAMSK